MGENCREKLQAGREREKAASAEYRLEESGRQSAGRRFYRVEAGGVAREDGFRETVRFHFDPIPDPEMFVVVDQVHGSSRSMEKTGLHFSRHQTGILSQE